MQATKQQIKAINAFLAKNGLMEEKPAIISNATNGRTTHSTELTLQEAKQVLAGLLKPKEKDNGPMIRKLFAMAHNLHWITETNEVQPDGSIIPVKGYARVLAWVEKYGYLGKPLNDYSYDELPKLVTQFELGPYKDYYKK